LLLLDCALEKLSARRFAEYLSLGQVPAPGADGAPPERRQVWVAAEDEALVLGPDDVAPEVQTPPDAVGSDRERRRKQLRHGHGRSRRLLLLLHLRLSKTFLAIGHRRSRG
jgi:hypothetical protein